jgi:hypothetical protein
MSAPIDLSKDEQARSPLLFRVPPGRTLRVSAGEMLIPADNFLQKQQKQRDLLC